MKKQISELVKRLVFRQIQTTLFSTGYVLHIRKRLPGYFLGFLLLFSQVELKAMRQWQTIPFSSPNELVNNFYRLYFLQRGQEPRLTQMLTEQYPIRLIVITLDYQIADNQEIKNTIRDILCDLNRFSVVNYRGTGTYHPFYFIFTIPELANNAAAPPADIFITGDNTIPVNGQRWATEYMRHTHAMDRRYRTRELRLALDIMLRNLTGQEQYHVIFQGLLEIMGLVPVGEGENNGATRLVTNTGALTYRDQAIMNPNLNAVEPTGNNLTAVDQHAIAHFGGAVQIMPTTRMPIPPLQTGEEGEQPNDFIYVEDDTYIHRNEEEPQRFEEAPLELTRAHPLPYIRVRLDEFAARTPFEEIPLTVWQWYYQNYYYMRTRPPGWPANRPWPDMQYIFFGNPPPLNPNAVAFNPAIPPNLGFDLFGLNNLPIQLPPPFIPQNDDDVPDIPDEGTPNHVPQDEYDIPDDDHPNIPPVFPGGSN